MTDRLAVTWQFCADPHCPHPTPHYYTRVQDGPPPDYEAMWEDCRRHRDNAERRARHYMGMIQQIEAIVTPAEDLEDEDDPNDEAARPPHTRDAGPQG